MAGDLPGGSLRDLSDRPSWPWACLSGVSGVLSSRDCDHSARASRCEALWAGLVVKVLLLIHLYYTIEYWDCQGFYGNFKVSLDGIVEVVYTGGTMTQYKTYHLQLYGPRTDIFKPVVAALDDFEPSGNGTLVSSSLGRAREVARAVITLSPGTVAEIHSVDVRSGERSPLGYFHGAVKDQLSRADE